jgi:hypothetical protein
MRFKRVTLLLIAAAPGVGCGAPSEAPAVASVIVAPGAADVAVGDAVAFAATVRDAQGNVLSGPQVFWASEDTSVVAVSDVGVATARRPGTARIAASAEGRSGMATVTVRPTNDGGDDNGDGGRGHRDDHGRSDQGDDGGDGAGADR